MPPADSKLEAHLKSVLSRLVEAIGVRGIIEGNLDAVATRAAAAMHPIRASV